MKYEKYREYTESVYTKENAYFAFIVHYSLERFVPDKLEVDVYTGRMFDGLSWRYGRYMKTNNILVPRCKPRIYYAISYPPGKYWLTMNYALAETGEIDVIDKLVNNIFPDRAFHYSPKFTAETKNIYIFSLMIDDEGTSSLSLKEMPIDEFLKNAKYPIRTALDLQKLKRESKTYNKPELPTKSIKIKNQAIKKE